MAKSISSIRPDHSDVVVFPPLIPAAGFLFGLLLQWAVPLRPPVPSLWQFDIRMAGGALFAVGIAGFVWTIATMWTFGTPIHNAKTPTAVVRTGPFRWSRNPMYLFGSLGYAGLATMLLLPWALLLLAPVVAATHYGVVLREEAFMERRFGEAYRAYKQSTPRWL